MIVVSLSIRINGEYPFHLLDFGKKLATVFERHNIKMGGYIEPGSKEYVAINPHTTQGELTRDPLMLIYGFDRNWISENEFEDLMSDLARTLDIDFKFI